MRPLEPPDEMPGLVGEVAYAARRDAPAAYGLRERLAVISAPTARCPEAVLTAPRGHLDGPARRSPAGTAA
ncbi:hypothetical protein [Streptomyces cinereospinus]|uniref:Uncharacterized protein n=1 Tax=Streptomyces cinereospinus TaxID=285561 RepID=A0ABV5MZ86_9ACTN